MPSSPLQGRRTVTIIFGTSDLVHRLARSLLSNAFHFESLHLGQHIEGHFVEYRPPLDVIGV